MYALELSQGRGAIFGEVQETARLLTSNRSQCWGNSKAQLAEKDFKITALTHELTYLKRIRYGKASEVLTGEQCSLFEDAVDIDLVAIEGELESQASSKPARKRFSPANFE